MLETALGNGNGCSTIDSFDCDRASPVRTHSLCPGHTQELDLSRNSSACRKQSNITVMRVEFLSQPSVKREEQKTEKRGHIIGVKRGFDRNGSGTYGGWVSADRLLDKLSSSDKMPLYSCKLMTFIGDDPTSNSCGEYGYQCDHDRQEGGQCED